LYSSSIDLNSARILFLQLVWLYLSRKNSTLLDLALADPGFDLKGGVDFVNGEGGRKSLKLLKVEVKVILACFGHIAITIMLKTNRERSEQRIEKS